ncbi:MULTISPECIES: hypothetical protein [Stenotrophomonas]|jgi:hypothetical protein|uniref:Uncharacterized protein n=1 Tax=Stenotrophomonas maltophilia TaxID=40324 RepID=A0A2J0UG22_STEMA|nr:MULTISPECIES: hypothetical protein [Stenotrophomonas]PJL33812.1 hypothetical protein B9Y64_01580 [Stenotrophomonas maltophilia]HDS1147629.1 hypothetical protein [Stenotrophomonas maltophilia]HDS1159220.1 hypothetical protein [Stenotrophomonas maltophilia]
MSADVNSIEWDAPIVPGVSMAAIPLHASYGDLDAAIAAYLIDPDAQLYRFEGGPDLRLERYGPDEHGNGGFLFSLPGDDRAGDMAALSITIGGGVVWAIKVYELGMPGDVVARKSYRGLAAGSIGIGSLVSDFLGFTELHFDEAEEWFCSGGEYGAREVSGWGVPLEDQPEQVVTAICVVA